MANWLDFFSLITKLFSCFNLLVSTPIYLSVLTFLLSQKHRSPFNSSFYTLFITLGFVDLSKYLLYILKKCSYWGWVPDAFYPLDQPNRSASILYFLLWALALAQFQLNFLLSLNRFLSICFSQFYRSRWTHQITRYLLATVFAVSLSATAPILWQPVCFRSTLFVLDAENGDGAMFTIKLTGPVFMNISTLVIYYNVTKVFAVSHISFLLVAYPCMCKQIRRINLRIRTHGTEVRMLYALVLLSIANVLFAAYLITWDILSRVHPELAPLAEWSLYMIIDFYDMNNPYGLLITSKVVRKYTLPGCLWCRVRRKAKWKTNLENDPQQLLDKMLIILR